MEALTTIGILGATIILVLFLLNQMGKVDKDDFIYDLGNFIGSATLLYYSYLLGSIPFMILNIIWAGYSLRDVLLKK